MQPILEQRQAFRQPVETAALQEGDPVKMAEKISELSGEAREQRIAELKRKMQEAAKKAKSAHAAGEGEASAPKAAAAPAKAAPRPAAAAVATAPAPAKPITTPAAPAPVDGNGTAPKPRPAPAPPRPPAPKVEEAATPPLTQAEMTRREFLTYAWGGAMALLALEAGVASFLYLYPRFREGEFGGNFRIPVTNLPSPDAAPQPNTDGKFWFVQTAEGEPKAIYMVCTHLGCLYKWEPSNNRFECPCHGSKFSHDGFYIEGPAPRSLDYFEITEENGEYIIATGRKITGAPAAESPARAQIS